MTSEEFNHWVAVTHEKSVDILCQKADEYSKDTDRLANFKQAAALLRTTPESALQGMLTKHIISLYDFIDDLTVGVGKPIEKWDEKIIDAINYLILLRTLLIERYGYSK